jgi:hypothetical protein
MTTRLDRQAGRAEGGRRKDRSHALVAGRWEWLILRVPHPLVIRSSTGGTATADFVAHVVVAAPCRERSPPRSLTQKANKRPGLQGSEATLAPSQNPVFFFVSLISL